VKCELEPDVKLFSARCVSVYKGPGMEQFLDRAVSWANSSSPGWLPVRLSFNPRIRLRLGRVERIQLPHQLDLAPRSSVKKAEYSDGRVVDGEPSRRRGCSNLV